MVVLQPLEVDEANALVEETIRSFAAERLPADQVTDAAFERVREELHRRLLPDGTLTSGHRFAAIVSDGERVGRVWFGPLQTSHTDMYICDITIGDNHRGQGHAKAAIELILDDARQHHRSRVGLTIAHANVDAVALCESLGFITTSSDDSGREMWSVVDS